MIPDQVRDKPFSTKRGLPRIKSGAGLRRIMLERSLQLPSRRHGIRFGFAHARETGVEIGLEILEVLETDIEAKGRALRPPLGRRPIAGAVEGDHETFETAPRKAHAEELQ